MPSPTGKPWRSRIADASAQSGSPRADAFAHEQLVVATGTAGEPSDDLEAVGRMEVRRLEAVRVECELGAVALACDVLGGPHEAAAHAAPSHGFADPQGLDPTAVVRSPARPRSAPPLRRGSSAVRRHRADAAGGRRRRPAPRPGAATLIQAAGLP